MSDSQFENFLSKSRNRINSSLDEGLALISKESPRRLIEALRYSTLNRGKRLRALLVYVVGKSYGVNLRVLDAPAVAIEMIHAFSLIHDDLPAMDNDSLRRGKPTCHLAFDEATAILVGDSLAVGAFEVLSGAKGLAAEQKLAMTGVLAKAAGLCGMVAGQYIDMHSDEAVTRGKLEKMYLLKTGALINAAINLGAIAAGVTNKKELELLSDFGLSIGLAFQIKDDLLDVEGDAKVIGKNTGVDKALNKITYPELVGLKAAKDKVKRLRKKADDILSKLKIEEALLQELVDYIFEIDC